MEKELPLSKHFIMYQKCDIKCQYVFLPLDLFANLAAICFGGVV